MSSLSTASWQASSASAARCSALSARFSAASNFSCQSTDGCPELQTNNAHLGYASARPANWAAITIAPGIRKRRPK